MVRDLIDQSTDAGVASIPARSQQQALLAEAHRLYEIHGKPLEEEHHGEFVAIARDGRKVLGETSLGVLERARAELGPGNFVFKIGEVTLGKFR